MKLSTQTDVIAKRIGEEKAIVLLAEAGYDALDLSLFDMLDKHIDTPKNSSDYAAYAKKLKRIAEDNGVYFNQAHAPFPSSLDGYEDFNKEVAQKILRAIEFSAIAGVKNIVVHPKQHLTYRIGNNKQILRDINLEFYNSLIPYCEKFNINVCIENMWQYDDNKMITHSTCSTQEEFREYLDMIDHPKIVACLDIGHANLMNADIYQFICCLNEKLKALHVHEAGYNVDFHRLPYLLGTTDWDSVLKALAHINYEGDLTFEADSTLLYMPDDMLLPTAKFMVQTGRSMIAQFQRYKNQ